jgi:hypothetical protein
MSEMTVNMLFTLSSEYKADMHFLYGFSNGSATAAVEECQ